MNSVSPGTGATRQVLLGYKKLETTALYTQVATEILREVISPLEAVRPS